MKKWKNHEHVFTERFFGRFYEDYIIMKRIMILQEFDQDRPLI